MVKRSKRQYIHNQHYENSSEKPTQWKGVQQGWSQQDVAKVNTIDNDTERFAFIGKKNADILLGKKKVWHFVYHQETRTEVSTKNHNFSKQTTVTSQKTSLTSQKKSAMNRKKLENAGIHWKSSNYISKN